MNERQDLDRSKAHVSSGNTQDAVPLVNREKVKAARASGSNEGLSKMLRAVRATKKLQRHAPALQRVNRDIDLPLSYQQQRLWFMAELEPDSPAQNSIRAYRLIGPLNRNALENGLIDIIRRHEIFRTTLSVDGTEVKQRIEPDLVLNLEKSDLRQHPESEREAIAVSLAREWAVQPIDLKNGPIFRAALFRLDAQRHILLFISHNIVFDHHSWEVFNEELSELYGAYCQDRTSPLVDSELLYADFAHWQRLWLQGEVLESLRGYWRKQFDSKYVPTPLPSDHPKPTNQISNRADRVLTLNKDLTGALKAMSRHNGVTLYATLLAGINTLLYRYTGNRDVLLFSPTSGRKRFELQRLIGPVSNILCLRTDLSGDPSFIGLIHRVRDVVLGAYANQDLPFEQIMQTIQLDEGVNPNDLYQMRFIFLSSPVTPLHLSGLELQPVAVNNQTTKFDLELFMEDIDGELQGSLTYNKAMFEADTIERLLNHLRLILQTMADDPEQPISTPMLAGVDASGTSIDCASAAAPNRDKALRLVQTPAQQMSTVQPESAPGGSDIDITERLKQEQEHNGNKSQFLRKPDSHDFIENMLRQIWRETLGVSEFGSNDDFFEIGGSSLGAMRMLVQIEETFGQTLPVSAFAEQPTISALTKRIHDGCPWSEQSDLVPVRTHGRKTPFFFVFGDAAYLSRHLPPEQPFYWFTRWPKRLRLAKKATPLPELSINQVAAEYVKQLRRVQPRGPYLLGGSCAGGIVAFEVARQLRELGQEVDLLVLFDLPNLKRSRKLTFAAKIERERKLLRSIEGAGPKTGYVVKSAFRTISNLPLFKRNVGAMMAKAAIKFYVTTGRPMPLELTRRYTHGRIAEALPNYKYLPYDGPVDLFFSELWIGPSDQEYRIPENSVWHKALRGPVEIHHIPGATHHEIFHEPHIRLFAKELNRSLYQRDQQQSDARALA